MQIQKTFIKLIFCLILLITYGTASVSDITDGLSDIEGKNGGQAVAKFLTIPISARQLALGGLASTPDDHTATSVYSSPAVSSFFSKYQFIITHQEWTWGLRKEYIGANFPLLDWGTAGISAQMFTLGKFEFARDINENPIDPKFIEFMLTASYGKQIIHERIAIGANISYLESRLDGIAGRAFSSSVDALFNINSIFRTGIYVRNVGTSIKYNSQKENQPFQVGINFRVEPIPQDKKRNHRGTDLKITAGTIKSIDEPLEIAGGIEFKPIKYFALRGGYDYFLGVNKKVAGLSAGLGLDVKNYGIDAGIKFQAKDFAPVWGATIRYSTEEIIPKTAEDYYKVANRFYRRKKYKTTIRYSKKALKLNPNMWKAHSLITNAIAAMHREAGTEIVLIYTANINDQYSSIAANGYQLGGIARHLTKIKEIQDEIETNIIIDGGNFIGAKTSREKAEFSQRYFKSAGYDVFCAGSNEVDFSANRSGLAEKPVKYICTDCKATKNLFTIDTLILHKGKYRIAVLNINNPTSNTKDLQQRTLEIVRYTQTKDIRNCDIRILAVDDSWENIKYYAQNIPLAEIILCSSLEQKFETPLKIRNSVIVSPGMYGHYLGLLSLRFDKNKDFKSYVNNLIPITDEIKPDPLISKLVSGSRSEENSSPTDIKLTDELIENSNKQGVFTFISDRHGKPRVHLKVIDKMAEFPLSDSSIVCSDPILSFKNNSIVYLVNNKNGYNELHSMKITGEKSNRINFQRSVFEAKFSSDHKWLYAIVEDSTGQKNDIYRIKPGAEESFRVINWPDGTEKDLDFSNDNSNMLFASDRDGKFQVYISDPLGKTPLRLTDADAVSVLPKFSPNSRQVAYLSDRGNLKERKDIWIYNRDNGKTTRITRDANLKNYLWLDSKGTILYSAGINLLDMNTINIFSGTNKRLIQKESQKNYSEKDPKLISYNDKTFILYTKEFINGKKEVWICNVDGTGDSRAVLQNGNNWLK